MRNSTLLFLLLALSGCGKEKIQSVDFFVAHDVERKETLEQCKKNPDARTNMNCRNAFLAQKQINRKKLGSTDNAVRVWGK